MHDPVILFDQCRKDAHLVANDPKQFVVSRMLVEIDLCHRKKGPCYTRGAKNFLVLMVPYLEAAFFNAALFILGAFRATFSSTLPFSSARLSRLFTKSTSRNSGVTEVGKRCLARKSNSWFPSVNLPCRLWLYTTRVLYNCVVPTPKLL